jgi:hypothetical protein
MDWSNERYVRVYCRDTPSWAILPWEARALWLFLLRRMDRAGTMDLGKHGTKGSAASIGMPVELVEPMLPLLLEDGCLVHEADRLRVPNYIPANETPSSGAERMRAYRERSRARNGTEDNVEVAERHQSSRNVTKSDAEKRGVTRRDSVPCRAVPYHAKEEKILDPAGSRLADALRQHLVTEKPNHELADQGAWTRRRPTWAKQLATVAKRRGEAQSLSLLAWVFGDQDGRTEFRFRVDSPKALAEKFDKLELAMTRKRANGAPRPQAGQRGFDHVARYDDDDDESSLFRRGREGG